MTELIEREPGDGPGDGQGFEAGLVAGGVAAAEAARVAALRASLGGVLDTVESVDRIQGATAAARAELIDAARRTSEALALEGSSAGSLGSEPHGWNAAVRARRELVFDLAVRLRIPERTAETLIGESERLVQRLPATHQALGAGEISYRHAQIIIDQTAGLSDVVTREFEKVVLPRAKELTVSKFKHDALKKREALDPDSIERRHTAAVEDRNCWVDPQPDGMAILSTLMTAENAIAAFHRITRIAMANAGTDGGTAEDDAGVDGTSGTGKRTLAQRRADAATDLLLDGDLCDRGDPVPHGIRPNVLVTVPVLTLLGQAETPAHLDGYGPIAPDTARDLAVKAPGFARILTDPITSAILDFDRSKYAVPNDLKQVVRLQHETCTAPGCNKRAVHCQLDHTTPFNDTGGGSGGSENDTGKGTTCLANLSPLCTEHHNLKHHTKIGLAKLPDGSMHWTTATGKTATVRPTNILGDAMLHRGGSPGGGSSQRGGGGAPGSGEASPGSAPPGSAPPGSAPPSTAPPGTAPPRTAPPGVAQSSASPPGDSWDDPPGPDVYPF